MRQDNAPYAAMVENLDENIGRILQFLKKQNLEDNTIVILSSDHGGLSNEGTKKRNLATSNFPLRAGKGHLYEGGIKIPLFVKWKGHLQPRTEEKSIVLLMDLFPTLLDITANKQLNTEGKSFLPVLQKKESWKDRTIFWHVSKARPVNTGDSKASVIRKGDYKLIEFYEQNRIELYNIAIDPSEKNNIAIKNPIITNGLLAELHQWKSNF
jgi:arylsulfatase A-like enzyme